MCGAKCLLSQPIICLMHYLGSSHCVMIKDISNLPVKLLSNDRWSMLSLHPSLINIFNVEFQEADMESLMDLQLV